MSSQGGTHLIVGDITLEETKSAICRCFLDRPCDVLVGGVPCQPWSASGKGRGFADPRGRLWFDYLEMVRRLNPRMVIAENVPGLATHAEALKTILSRLDDLGYRAEHKVLNAADFGVPQIRQRLWIIATRRDWRNLPIIWPQPQFGPAPEGNPT